MAQLCNYPKLAGVTIEDRSYATNTINKGYATVVVGDTTNQTCFNVGVTAIDNWSERQDACWFMGAGVGVYDVPVCYLGGKYLNDSSVNRVQTLGSVSYLIRAGIIQRSGLKLYDKYVLSFFGSNTYIIDNIIASTNFNNTYIANYSTAINITYSNTYIITSPTTFPIQGSDLLFANVVLLMPMTTASGITDIKGKLATNQGATISTAIVNPFGQSAGVLSFPGNGAQISIAQSSDFAFGADAMTIDGWLYPTSVPTTGDFGFMDTRAAPNTAADWAISGNVSNQIAMYDTSTPFYEYKSPGLILNQWNYICFARPITTGTTTKLWINGALVGSNATRNNSITAGGSLKIGNTIDVVTSNHTTFTGYMSNIRITRAYRDGSVVPTAPFPTF